MYLPSNDDESCAKGAGWGVCLFFVLLGVIFGVLFLFMGTIEEKLLGVAFIVLGLVLGYFGYGWGLAWATNSSKCPNCKKPFCIEYTQETTISESIIREAKNKKIVSYRVGVKGINWRCTSCGHEGYGEKKYKEEI